MSDILIPLATAISVASPIVVGLSVAVVATWKRADTVAERERKDCNERIAKIEKRVEKLETEADDLREDNEHWRSRWEREVRRGVELAAMPSDGTPFRPPAPSDEDTQTRELRTLITEEALRQYLESTPPGPVRRRMPSKPK